jgi:hypothetical protein
LHFVGEAAKEIKFIAQVLISGMGITVHLPVIWRIDNIGAICIAYRYKVSFCEGICGRKFHQDNFRTDERKQKWRLREERHRRDLPVQSTRRNVYYCREDLLLSLLERVEGRVSDLDRKGVAVGVDMMTWQTRVILSHRTSEQHTGRNKISRET